jgi:hypothetical protein
MKNRNKQIALVAEIVHLAYELVDARAEVRKREAMLAPGATFCLKHYEEITKKLQRYQHQRDYVLDRLDKKVPALAKAGYLHLKPLVRPARPALKPWIEVYWDDAGIRGGKRGCWRARVRKDHRYHAAGQTWREAISDLLLTLKSLDKKYHKSDYRYVMLDYDLRQQGEDHGIAITL